MPRDPPKRVYCNKRTKGEAFLKRSKSDNDQRHYEEKLKEVSKAGASCVVSKDPKSNKVMFLPLLPVEPSREVGSKQGSFKENKSSLAVLGFPKEYKYVSRKSEDPTQLMQKYLMNEQNETVFNNNIFHKDQESKFREDDEPLLTQKLKSLMIGTQRIVGEAADKALFNNTRYREAAKQAEINIFKRLEELTNRKAIERITHPEKFTTEKPLPRGSGSYTPSMASAPAAFQETPGSSSRSSIAFGPFSTRRFRTSTPREFLPRSLDKSLEKSPGKSWSRPSFSSSTNV